MLKITNIFNKEDGSVMVAALLMLVLLTIIGISATSTSNSELNVTTNAQLHKMSFFVAESGWHVMTDWLDDHYPLPTVDLFSDNWMAQDGTDNDGDGSNNEHDENFDFTNSQVGEGFPDPIPFSDAKQNYEFTTTAEFMGAGIAAGWDPTAFLRYNYTIESIGTVPARTGNAVSQITVTAGKIQEK